MGCDSVLDLLLLSAGLLSVTGGSQTLLTLVAEPGDDVTIWSNHTLEEPAHIFWFRHTNASVPHLLTCLQYKLYSSPASCSFIPQSSRMVMTVNSDKTSFSITEVNYTDSGLYYCCIQRDNYITFSNATFLLVRDVSSSLEGNETLFNTRASSSSDLFFMLTVVFSVVIVMLLGALIIILKGRKQCRDEAGSKVKEEEEEQGAEQVNYAALQFSSKTNRRSGGHSEDPQVLYSSVRH
ncbi:hypothetical protein SRHO_G00258590 [Serrasalmus rhombeus]